MQVTLLRTDQFEPQYQPPQFQVLYHIRYEVLSTEWLVTVSAAGFFSINPFLSSSSCIRRVTAFLTRHAFIFIWNDKPCGRRLEAQRSVLPLQTLTRLPDALHYQRLMGVEDKHFKRITKRLLDPHSLISPSASLPTPPPDATADDSSNTTQSVDDRIKQWREDMLLDFANFEASMVRLQLLQQSNDRERARYAAEKLHIQQTADAVRNSTVALRVQLGDAQRLLETRKAYDALTEKITTNKALKPRQDQHASLAKLEAEIAELEHESKNYAHTWVERREQFGRIVEEGRQMLKLIRDEKEEAERKEGMEGVGDHEEGESSERRVESGPESRDATPRPDGITPRPEDGATPRIDMEAATPSQSGHLSPPHKPLPGHRSRLDVVSPAPSGSRLSSPGTLDHEHQSSERPDAQMEETLVTGIDDGAAVDMEMEEGEENEEGEEREAREDPEVGEHEEGEAEGEGTIEQVETMDES